MSAESLPEQRTEMPTEKRMGELRKQGAIFHSQDLEHIVVLLSGFIFLSWTWHKIFFDIQYVFKKSFSMIAEINTHAFEVNDLTNGFIRLIILIIPNMLLMILGVGAISILAVSLQTGWNRREPWIKYQWSFLNPLNGLKRIFSVYGLINFLKSFSKFVLISPIAYFALKDFAPRMVMLIHASMEDVMALTGSMMTKVFWKTAYVFIFVALVDYGWGKFRWLKQYKMTKEEVKDERKAMEGDESTKRKMIAKGLQRAAQRLRKTIPLADVIVTNPTHYAIALKYDRDKSAAPIVVGKGTDFIAQQIRMIAKEHKIPILERKALARALYASTEVGSEIPRELFRAVAEVLAYVFKLKNPQQRAASQRAQS